MAFLRDGNVPSGIFNGYHGAEAMLRVLVGMALWWGAERVARYLLPQRSEEGTDTYVLTSETVGPQIPLAIDADALLTVALATLGAYLFVDASAEIFRTLGSGVMYRDLLFEEWTNAQWADYLIQPIAQVVFALWLTLGSRGIARGIQRLRSAK